MRTQHTPAAELSSIRIRWDKPGEGRRLQAAFWARHGGPPRNPKRVSPAGRAAAWRRFRELCAPPLVLVPGELMRALFRAGRLTQYRTVARGDR